MSDSSESEGEFDRELQAAFSKGLIKGKLVTGVETKKQVINNKAALQEILTDIKSKLPWIERMDLTVVPVAPPKPLLDQLGADPDDLIGDEVHNDFKREFKFHRQAQAAVLEGIPRLHHLGIPTRRPDDYFAEMCKSDEHMKKVREKLVTSQLRIERSEKAKKLRDLRKYGKKVQQEVKMRRQKEKKEMSDAIKNYRKGKETSLDFLDDKKKTKNSSRQATESKKQTFQPNKRRQFKNEKFGFGGQKKRSKSNTAASVDDVSSFSARRNAANPAKFKKAHKGKNKNRPGKSKRQQMKNKKR